MGQIMQRLLEGVQGELQAQERDLCAHLNAHAHLLLLEAHLDCLEGSGASLDGLATPDSKGKGKPAAATPQNSPEDAGSGSMARGKRRLTPGKLSLHAWSEPLTASVLTHKHYNRQAIASRLVITIASQYVDSQTGQQARHSFTLGHTR